MGSSRPAYYIYYISAPPSAQFLRSPSERHVLVQGKREWSTLLRCTMPIMELDKEVGQSLLPGARVPSCPMSPELRSGPVTSCNTVVWDLSFQEKHVEKLTVTGRPLLKS